MKSFLSDLTRVGSSKFVVIFSGLITSVLVARSLGPSANGLIAALLAFPSLLSSIGSLGLRQSIAYHMGKKLMDEADLKRNLVQIWLLSTVSSILLAAVLAILSFDKNLSFFYVVLSLVVIPFNLFNTYNTGLFLGKREIKKFSQTNWIPALTTLGLVCLFWCLKSLTVASYLVSIILGPALVSVILFQRNKFIRNFTWSLNVDQIKMLLKSGGVYAIALLFINLNARLDILLLKNLSGDFDTGIYAKASSVANYILQIPWVFSSLILSRSITSTDNYQFSLRVVSLLRVTSILIGAVCLMFILFSKDIILLLFGPEYIESSTSLRYLVPGVFVLALFKILNQDLAGRGMPLIALKAMLPALVMNLILNVYLIPEYGAKGAAIASSISYFLAIIVFIMFYTKLTAIRLIMFIKFSRKDFQFIGNQFTLRKY